MILIGLIQSLHILAPVPTAARRLHGKLLWERDARILIATDQSIVHCLVRGTCIGRVSISRLRFTYFHAKDKEEA